MSVSTQTNAEVPSIPLYKLKEVYEVAEYEGSGRRIFVELTEDEIYPSSHEDDMGETDFHYILNSYLWNALKLFFRERNDIFIAANINLYYDEQDPKKWVAPDIMAAFGIGNHKRRTYKLWQEKMCPQVVIEVASASTWKNDIDDKLKTYEQLGVEEYYVLESEKRLPFPFMAYLREGEKLKFAFLENDRILSPQLGLEIVRTNEDIRLFDPNKKQFLPTVPEMAEKAEKFDEAQAEIERLKAELAKLKGEN